MQQYSFIRELRNETVLRIYDQVRASEDGKRKPLCQVAATIADMEMQLHFISYRMARQYYNDYFYNGITRKKGHGRNKRIYDSFLSLCRDLRNTGHTPADDRDVIAKALLSPSPCIGLTPRQIQDIISKHRDTSRKRKKKLTAEDLRKKFKL